MKQTLNIARNELYSMYYSPIAWVIMILFLVLTSIDYTGLIARYLNAAERGGFYLRYVLNLTNTLLGGEFKGIIGNLYLFFPLITMGLISTERRKGTIKLLYSSPVEIREIVLGKFIAIVVFTLALIGLVLFTLVGLSITLANPDFGHMTASLIGLFFVLCTYAAIGLFISALTTYSIVAAIITFGVFALFSNASAILNNVHIARDITFYLNIQARTRPLVNGLLNTRDIVYFLVITGSFLSFTMIKLKSDTESVSVYRKTGRYALVVVVAFIVGYISTRPQLTAYLDSTRDQLHSITPPTQNTLAKFNEDDLQVTVFANLLSNNFSRFNPRRQNNIVHSILGPYIRFNPNIEVKFVYYYAESKHAFKPPSAKGKSLKERAKKAAKNNDMSLDQVLTLDQVKELYNVEQENSSNFFLLTYNDKQTVVRTFRDMQFWPSENEWAAGFKRLLSKSPTIAFLSGHGERSPFSEQKISYHNITSTKKNRRSLMNQGYTIDTLSLQDHPTIPTDIAGLAIVDPGMSYSSEEIKKIRKYISAGGNLFVAGEPDHRKVIQPVLDLVGLSLHDGRLVQSNKRESGNVVTAYLTKAAQQLSPQFYKYIQDVKKYYGDSTYAVDMKISAPLTYHSEGDFNITPLLKTDEGQSWMRFSPIPRDSLHKKLERSQRSQAGPFATAVMMDRQVNGKKQIVIAAGDADYLAPTGLTIRLAHRKFNYPFGFYAFSQFSDGKFPANTMRPQTDDQFAIESEDVIYQTATLIYIIPLLMALLASIILIRRKRK